MALEQFALRMQGALISARRSGLSLPVVLDEVVDQLVDHVVCTARPSDAPTLVEQAVNRIRQRARQAA